jgi:hypothetical protein
MACRLRTVGEDAHDHPARAGDRARGSGRARTATAGEPPSCSEARAVSGDRPAPTSGGHIRRESDSRAGVAPVPARAGSFEPEAEAGSATVSRSRSSSPAAGGDSSCVVAGSHGERSAASHPAAAVVAAERSNRREARLGPWRQESRPFRLARQRGRRRARQRARRRARRRAQRRARLSRRAQTRTVEPQFVRAPKGQLWTKSHTSLTSRVRPCCFQTCPYSTPGSRARAA